MKIALNVLSVSPKPNIDGDDDDEENTLLCKNERFFVFFFHPSFGYI
jgi:hypothetical protein